MARMPIEIVPFGDIPIPDLELATRKMNDFQDEFVYSFLSVQDTRVFRMHLRQENLIEKIFVTMEQCRTLIRGFHPFLIVIVDHQISNGRWNNVFGHHKTKQGFAITTTYDVPDIIIPSARMAAYFTYYLARWTYTFTVPDHRSHQEPRGCIFDFKANKPEIIQSMKSGALCQECHQKLLYQTSSLTPAQYEALDKLFELSGHFLHNTFETMETGRSYLSLVNEPRSTERIQLYDILRSLFSTEELEDICFRIGVDWDNIGSAGGAKDKKSRDLISLLERTNRLQELIGLVRTLRPEARL
jgi:hypothetical protein